MHLVTRPVAKALRPVQLATRAFSSSIIAQQEGSSKASPEAPKKTSFKSATGADWGARTSATLRPALYNKSLDTIDDVTKNLSKINSMEQTVEIDPSFYPRFEIGMTYDPFDFSMTKIKMDRQARFSQMNNRLDTTSVDLDDIWKNPQLLSDFVNNNGKILKGVVTGNSPKTQKKIAKAIRRARAAGLMPYFHKPHASFRN